MRSIRYQLTHRPRNLDDCLDLARRKLITAARLRLRYHEPIREPYPFTRLLAQFEVRREDKVTTVEELCGGYLHSDPEAKKLSEVSRANAKLEQSVSILSDYGVVLSGSDQEFEYRPTTAEHPSGKENPYERFAGSDLLLRDQLAIDRTILANERTFLAYCRSALALVLTGAGCIKFFDSALSDIAGWTLIALGVIVTAVGIWRTAGMARNIGTARERQARRPAEDGHTSDSESTPGGKRITETPPNIKIPNPPSHPQT